MEQDRAFEDYYLEPNEARGPWVGVAAADLGMSGEIDADSLRRVLDGLASETLQLHLDSACGHEARARRAWSDPLHGRLEELTRVSTATS
jgi:hypothetical protein